MDRLERLKALVEKNPTDAFPLYGLAMEYRNRSQHEQAVKLLEELLVVHPDYGAAYYQLGMSLVALEKPAGAREVFEKGIRVADEKGDSHAREELTAALEHLEVENQ